MVDVTEFAPCPVCGEQPRWRGSARDYRVGIFRLQCIGETHLFQSYGATEAEAIAAWNTRAQAAELEALRGEVERLKDERDEQALLYAKTLEQWVALRARNAALEEAAAKVLPFNVENGPDYASVYFGDGSTHSTQAMTMNPQDWLDLEAALRALLNQNGEA